MKKHLEFLIVISKNASFQGKVQIGIFVKLSVILYSTHSFQVSKTDREKFRSWSNFPTNINAIGRYGVEIHKTIFFSCNPIVSMTFQKINYSLYKASTIL